MTNNKQTHIIPRNRDFAPDGDHLGPYCKRLFRFVRRDESMPVYTKVELTRKLFMGIWAIERHMAKVIRMQDLLSNGQSIDWDKVEEDYAYPEELLQTAFGLLKERYQGKQPMLDEAFVREVHESIMAAYRIFYPPAFKESPPETAMDFFCRGQRRIQQTRFNDAMADFTRANDLEPDNHTIEFALAQFWHVFGKNDTKALGWIDRAIEHLGTGSPHSQAMYQIVRVAILFGLKQYGEVVRSLRALTEALGFMIEKLDWENGEPPLGNGTIHAEGVRGILNDAIEVSKHLLEFLCGTAADEVQIILREQKRLWRLL